MADVTAQMVKSLRDRTGAGMMDCRNALAETHGDEDKAVEVIQKKGLAKAAKKAGAIATEGLVHSYIHPGSRIGVLVEVNCQTDFAARSEDFRQFVEDVGLQIASMSPLYTRPSDVSEDEQKKQKEIFRAQMQEEEERAPKKKPPEAVEKILEGKIAKWLTEVCLSEQVSIRSADKTVQQLADELSGKIGEKISVRRFVRFELGEGIETQKRDLAAEVAETLKGV